MTVKNFEELQVWQLAMDLVDLVYKLTESFPANERYRLADQLCRAAVSVPSNIAEGSKRHTTREYMRFVGISRGSLVEIETQLLIARRQSYIAEDALISARTLTDKIGHLLGGLYNALEKKLNQTDSSPTLTPALAP